MLDTCAPRAAAHSLHPRMRRFFHSMTARLCLVGLWLTGGVLLADDTASVRLADGFALPCGIENGKRYYKARGFRPNGHLGEDWNGVGGGNTDLGDPVHAAANGLVVYARDFRAGWGNVVIIRHAYLERGDVRFVDSLYGHLHRIHVREGQRVERGQQVGTIGTGGGRYPAHLHFEIRKDIRVGMYRSMFPRDFRTYFDPTQFVFTHQNLGGGERTVAMPVNTFPNQSGFKEAGSVVAKARGNEPDRTSPVTTSGKRIVFTNGVRFSADTSRVTSDSKNSSKKGSFQIDRYEDIRRTPKFNRP
jgi:hypothetical protein